MHSPFSSPSAFSSSKPISSAFGAQALWLVALAMALTIGGVVLGATLALPLIASGWIYSLFFVELALIWTAQAWVRSSPLNIVLFCLFPIISGLTLTPVIISVLAGYANGASILLNALISTALLTASSAVLATITKDLGSSIGRFLFQALIGLIIFGLLQLFFPSLRTSGFEMALSGVGIVVFSLFLAFDIQRLLRRGDMTSPFLLAISIYLDIFNLFLYVLRFILAMSGERR